jgi:hypothetical protein
LKVGDFGIAKMRSSSGRRKDHDRLRRSKHGLSGVRREGQRGGRAEKLAG